MSPLIVLLLLLSAAPPEVAGEVGFEDGAAADARVRPLEELLQDPGARVMWVGAHPDDEALAGPILARACIALGRPCLMFVLNHGDGGRCPSPVGCWPDLGTVRHRELTRVARAFGAELEHHRLWNAPLPESSFPPRPAIAKRWREDLAARRLGDPADLVARAIRRFRPTILLTFDPHHGFTGHPEHQLASRFAMEAVRRAAPDCTPPVVYNLLNRYWMTRLAGTADPTEPTEEFDTHVSCGPPRRTCLDVALEITKHHHTQSRDMGRVRSLRPQIGALYLRRVDPVKEGSPSPYGSDGL